MKDKILSLLNSDEYTPSTVEDIYNMLGLTKADDFKVLIKSLNELEEQTIVIKTKKNKYSLLSKSNYHTGIIDLKDKGFGFIKSKDFNEDLYVNKEDTLDSNNQDEVLFRIKDKKTYDDERLEAVVIKVTKRSLKYAVGELYSHKGKYYLKTVDPKNKVEIEVEDLSYAVVGDIVQVEITGFYKGKKAFSKVIKVIGNKNDVGVDIASIAIDNGFSLEFSEKVMDEIKSINIDFDKEISRREDYTNDLIITIDGEDAKDLDDAISVEILPNGNYCLGVYIADVSYYVRENTELDKEAYERGTSCYLTDRVIPMLPHKLSNDLCSLNEHEKKLVIACLMEINNKGEVVSSSINEGVIKSTHRMTYSNCNKMLEDNDKEVIDKYKDIYQMLLNMQTLSKILKDMRTSRGALDFDVPEAKIIVDDLGKPIDVILRTRGISERMIEEFMLTANETVATTITNLDLPFIYRVHDQVNLQKLRDLNLILSISGYRFRVKNKIYTKELQNLLSEIKEEHGYLKTMILRMMAKAVYSNENIGHFGLASECYTHFTSPIRRYPDLIVHRLVRKYLFNYDVNVEELVALETKIKEIADHSSIKERDAIECEYQVDDLKKAEYMMDHIGEKYKGVITSVTSFGMFIALENTIEGLIRLSDLEDDYYEYVASLKTLIGVRTKNKYKIGDTVDVIVSSASKKLREINFKLVYNKPVRKYLENKPKHDRNKRNERRPRRRK